VEPADRNCLICGQGSILGITIHHAQGFHGHHRGDSRLISPSRAEDEINEMKEKVHPSALFTSHGSHGRWLWDFMGKICSKH